MKTKPADVPYCGVNEEKIKNAKPILNEEVLRYHHLYLTERHEIYKKKEILKLEAPWTDDEVLRDFRFTNVRREIDRESVWLVNNISTNDDLSFKEKVYWTILFRTYNKSSTFEILRFPESLDILHIDEDDIESLRFIIEGYSEQNPKYVWFTPAFNTGGLKFANAFPGRIKEKAYLNQPGLMVTLICNENGEEQKMLYKEARDYVNNNAEGLFSILGWEPNIPLRMIHMIKNLVETDLFTKLNEAKSQQEAFEALKTIHGFSNFLAYQVFVDLTYIPDYKFSENEFTISGPGCSLGLSFLFDDKDGMNDEELLFWVRDNIQAEWAKRGLEADYNKLFDHLPEHDRCLNIMMCENSFCELGKLTKAKRGTGRPRNSYKASKEVKKKETKQNSIQKELF